MSAITDCHNKGIEAMRANAIHMHFKNGNGISIIWGWGTYSDNHFTVEMPDFSAPGGESPKSSDTVEFMLLNKLDDPTNNLVKSRVLASGGVCQDEDRLYGYVPVDTLAEVLEILAHKL